MTSSATSPSASKLGFDPGRLEKIGAFLAERYVTPGRLPCAQVMVARSGQTVYQCELGFKDVEQKKSLRPDTLFRIYSMTKPITSVAFMMLVEEGRVMLDEPVSKYIPAFAKLQVYVSGVPGAMVTKAPKRPMLIIDLLRHTSGLTYGFQQRTAVDASYRAAGVADVGLQGTLDQMIEQLSGLPLEFSPGDAWNYSVSTDVLGYLVGKISGLGFEAFLNERILKPLGMVDTAFHVPADKVERFANCYTATPQGGLALFDSASGSHYLKPSLLTSGGGGLVSTLADYARFCTMLLRGGELEGRRYIGRKTLELMWSNHLPGGKDLPECSVSMFSESTYNGVGFGLGFSVVRDPAQTMIPGSVGEVAWGGMASTAFWIDPKEDLFTIFMTQLIPSSTYPVRRQLRTLVYSSLT